MNFRLLTLTGCPFSLARLVKVSDSGQVIYKAEKARVRSFPDPGGDGLQPGTKRNYQMLSPLDFLAEFTQHIPAKGAHLIRGHRPKVGRGWYSNKRRGMRKKAAAARSAAEPSAATVGADEASPSRSRQSWAMLIKRVYEIDPLSCPECGGQMAAVAFIEPPQEDVIEKILRGHQSGAMVGGLWRTSAARPPPADGKGNGVDGADRPDTEPHELTYVDMDTQLLKIAADRPAGSCCTEDGPRRHLRADFGLILGHSSQGTAAGPYLASAVPTRAENHGPGPPWRPGAMISSLFPSKLAGEIKFPISSISYQYQSIWSSRLLGPSRRRRGPFGSRTKSACHGATRHRSCDESQVATVRSSPPFMALAGWRDTPRSSTISC